jgi:Mg/Co/Ni transporter MgtE
VAEAMEGLKAHEEILETLNTLFLVDADGHLTAAVPLAKLFIAAGATPLKDLASEPLLQVDVEEKQDRITEIFDKYNLLALPVVDETGKLAGAITADEVISLLRQK